jgi:hypothetical protein
VHLEGCQKRKNKIIFLIWALGSMLREIGIYIYLEQWEAWWGTSRRMLGDTEKAIMHIKKR